MHVKARSGAAIEKIVLHDPEGANTARELANYLARIDAGYHAVVDDGELLQIAGDDLIVEGAGGMNTHALHICFVPGRAAWSRDQWLVHRAAIERGAQWVALKCAQYGIAPVRLAPWQVATSGAKGICTHGDVTAAGYTASEGHTDPGPNFPHDVFFAAVGRTLTPPKPTPPTWRVPVISLWHPEDKGIWIVMDKPPGAVSFVTRNGAVLEQGMNVDSQDRAAFGNRHVDHLEHRTRNDGTPGFKIRTVEPTPGYVPKNQR